MYPPREPNVRINTDQFFEQEFGMLPQSRASISFKSSRKPLPTSTDHNTAHISKSEGINLSAEPPRLTGTLSTAPYTPESDEDGDDNSSAQRRG